VAVTGIDVQHPLPVFVADEVMDACIIGAEKNRWTQECSSICSTNCRTWLEFVE